jgi:hypothetical protein
LADDEAEARKKAENKFPDYGIVSVIQATENT